MPFEIIEIDHVNGAKLRFRGYSSVSEAVDMVMQKILHANMTKQELADLIADRNRPDIWIVENTAKKCLVHVDVDSKMLPVYDILAGTYDWTKLPEHSGVWPLFRTDDRHNPTTLRDLWHYLAEGNHIHPCWYTRAPMEVYVTTTEQEDSKEMLEYEMRLTDPDLSDEERAIDRAEPIPPQGPLSGTYSRGWYETTVLDKSELVG